MILIKTEGPEVHVTLFDDRKNLIGYALLRSDAFFPMKTHAKGLYLQRHQVNNPPEFWKRVFEHIPCVYGWTDRRIADPCFVVSYGRPQGLKKPFIISGYVEKRNDIGITDIGIVEKAIAENRRVVVLFTRKGDDNAARIHMEKYAIHVPSVKYLIVDIDAVDADAVSYSDNDKKTPLVTFYHNQIKMDSVEAYKESDWTHHERFLYKPPYHEVFCDADIERLMDEHFYTGIFYTEASNPDMEYMRVQFERICHKRYIMDKTTIIAYRDKWPLSDTKYHPHSKKNSDPVCVGYLHGLAIKVEPTMEDIKKTLDDSMGPVTKKDLNRKVCKPNFL